MSYRFLAAELWQLADDVVGFYATRWGISPAKVKKEDAVPGVDLGFRPTLHASSHDHHLICVEVASTPYTATLDTFVLACRNHGLPVRLYVAVPQTGSATFQTDLRRALDNGVGVMEATSHGIKIVAEAQSLSLTDVRAPEPKSFPAAMRPRLAQALQTFRGGDPAKGCSNLYDELEALTRKVAKSALSKKAWRNLRKRLTEPKLGNVDKTPWHGLAKALLQHLDSGKLGRPRLTEALLGRVLGITSHRNATGHKPRNQAALRRRDRKLRTRFEEACDLLEEFANASRRA